MPAKRDIRKDLKDLQNIVGKSPKITISKFSNWAGTQVRDEILSVWPRTVEEAQAVVRGAHKLGLRLRAAGTTHSWTPLFSDEGNIIVHVRDLQRPDGPQIELIQDPEDSDTKLVTMATGTTSGEFRDFQLTHGVCIPANVILRVVQMGGVVAPACHGVGWDAKTVSDGLVRMRIIDSEGELRTYSMKDDPDMMHAIQCNLGLWGLIVDLTLKVDPMVIVETDNVWMKVKDLFYDQEAFRKIVHDNWSVEVFWFPFNGIDKWEALEAFLEGEIDVGEWDPKEDEVLLRLINKPDKVGQTVDSEYYKEMDFTDFVQAKGFQVVDSFISSFPQCAPSFLRTQVAQLKKQFDGKKILQQLPHAVHFKGRVQDVPVYDMEWSFSIDNDMSNVCNAIQKVVDLVSNNALNGKFPMNLPLEMRFMADSDAYMAPCSSSNPLYGGSGHTCYMEVLTVAHTPGWPEFCQQVADVWQTLPGARPHWCKEWSFLKDIDEFLRKSYVDMIPKYLGALERSGADPDGIFLNDRLEKILFPEGHQGWAKLSEATASKPTEEKKNNKSRTCRIL